MLLQKSVYEYAPVFMLVLVILVFSTLVIMRIIKRARLKKQALSVINFEGLKIDKILHYYSYECYLVEYYMKRQETASTATLHRDFSRALRRALEYAGVSKDVIAEYGNRKEKRL